MTHLTVPDKLKNLNPETYNNFSPKSLNNTNRQYFSGYFLKILPETKIFTQLPLVTFVTNSMSGDINKSVNLTIHIITCKYASQNPPQVWNPGQLVSCGSHEAASCAACPQVPITHLFCIEENWTSWFQGNGASWCNGDCVWSIGDVCVPGEVRFRDCKCCPLSLQGF